MLMDDSEPRQAPNGVTERDRYHPSSQVPLEFIVVKELLAIVEHLEAKRKEAQSTEIGCLKEGLARG